MAIVLLAVSLVYAKSSEIIKNDALNFMDINIQTVNQQLRQIHSNISNIMLKISVNESIISSIAEKYEEASYEEFIQQKNVEAIINSFIADESFIESILVIKKDGTSFFTNNNLLSRKEGSLIYNACINKSPESLFRYDGKLYLYRPIYTGNTEDVSIVAFCLDSESINSVFSSLQIPDSIFFSYTDEGELIGEGEDITDIDEIFNLTEYEDSSIVNIEGEKYFMMKYYIPELEIYTVGLVPHDTLIVDSLKILQITIIVTIVSVIVSILISYLLSRLICRNLKSLRISMLKISQGNLRERTEIPKEMELRDLALIFNRMMDRIDILISEATRNEIEKQKIMQDYLNVQIKPHFIYNTLNSIRYIALRNNEQELADAVSAAVELLRAVIGKSEDIVTVDTELKYAAEYVKLQNFRNNSNIYIETDIQNDILNKKIPILSMQPIVENACIHGLSGRGNGVIRINAYIDSGKIHIEIFDNGIGFDTEKYENLKLYGVGINNVFERFRLIYGSEFEGKIDSIQGKGTKVEFIYPDV